MNEPLVTVFIPVYNGDKFIAKAIIGILNQTYQNFELIIVNDGSTDNTVSEINKFSDNRIKLFHNEVNKGLTYTRNRGFELANGVFFAINDADDFSHPTRLKIQIDFMVNNPKVGICGSYANRVSRTKNHIWKYPLTKEEIKERLFWGSSVINSTAMFNMKLLRLSGLKYRDEFPPAEDYDLFERSISKFNIANIDKVLVDYLEHEHNVTFTQSDKMREASTRISVRQVEHLIGPITNKEKEMHYRFQHYIFNFSFEELVILEKYLLRIIKSNSLIKYYRIDLFEKHVSERFFQCVFHSKVNINVFSKSKLMKTYSPSIDEKVKSFLKSFI